MREILFRGKDICDGWHYGDYEYITDDFVKITNHSLLEHGKKVEIETVGQYTGLTDKNGKKIFEGDIIKVDDMSINDIFEIVWIESRCGYYGKVLKSNCSLIDYEMLFPLYNINHDFEVIGNIHDNPDLLKGVRENENK